MNTFRNVRQVVNRALLLGVGKLLRPLGLSVIPSEFARPCAWGAQPIVGSFPPYAGSCRIGNRKNYFVHDGYRHREQVNHFDDTPNTDQSQLEIYQFAKEISDREGLKTVVDIGCGSGYKLIRYLSHMTTVGIDLPQTCHWLREQYPDRIWKESNSFSNPDGAADLVMASDVIEH